MSKTTKPNTLWGSAFTESPTEAVIAFTAGRDVRPVSAADQKLLPYDIWVNKAHAVMLFKQNIIAKEDVQVILKGLTEIEQLAEKGEFVLEPAKEDVHTNIESWLTEKYGIEYAGKLHTARSRNDQTNTDTRLFLRDEVLKFMRVNNALTQSLLQYAEKYKEYIIPGFTHHQPAMMTTFGHLLMGFAVMIERDTERFAHWFSLHNNNPLGNAASYGTTFAIDQNLTAEFLGFDAPELNSFDEITNRWEAEADLAFAISTLMNHLSLMAQTFILFSTIQFGMIKLADSFSTGSSIMPQKKNPDPLEVIKGKTAFAAGQLQSLMGMGKANFIGYNRDSQWAKYVIMDLVDECLSTPVVMKGVVETMQVNKEKMAEWCYKGFIGTTSLLEQITSTFNIPFRKSKIIVEKAIKYSAGQDTVSFENLQKSLQEEGVSIGISKEQVEEWQDPYKILHITKSIGSPGLESMEKSINALKEEIKKNAEILQKYIAQKETAQTRLAKEVEELLK